LRYIFEARWLDSAFPSLNQAARLANLNRAAAPPPPSQSQPCRMHDDVKLSSRPKRSRFSRVFGDEGISLANGTRSASFAEPTQFVIPTGAARFFWRSSFERGLRSGGTVARSQRHSAR